MFCSELKAVNMSMKQSPRMPTEMYCCLRESAGAYMKENNIDMVVAFWGIRWDGWGWGDVVRINRIILIRPLIVINK